MLEIKVQVHYHERQLEVFGHPARFKVLMAGRRWGKTRGAINWLTEGALEEQGSLNWWVSPTYRQAKIAYRYFRKIFHRAGIIKSQNQTDLTFTLVTESVLEFRTSEIPDNLRGDGIKRLVVDESATVPEVAWTEVLRPSLMDSKGAACFIGTPKGMNWFHQLWLKGQGADPEWKSWQFSSYSNPFLDQNEIKQAESEMPELIARQEIWAEPLASEGVVFRYVDELAVLQPEAPKPGLSYAVGVDLAKYQDFTVITVTQGNREVWKERFNRIDWAIQKRRIMEVAARYNSASVVIDSTGVGDPIYEDLARAGLRVEPFTFTNTSKRELIDNLILKFDQKSIKILDDVTAKGELKAYQYEMTAGGRLKSGAPAGQHDDCVISLALSFWNKTPNPAQKTLVNLGGGKVRIFGS